MHKSTTIIVNFKHSLRTSTGEAVQSDVHICVVLLWKQWCLRLRGLPCCSWACLLWWIAQCKLHTLLHIVAHYCTHCCAHCCSHCCTNCCKFLQIFAHIVAHELVYFVSCTHFELYIEHIAHRDYSAFLIRVDFRSCVSPLGITILTRFNDYRLLMMMYLKYKMCASHFAFGDLCIARWEFYSLTSHR